MTPQAADAPETGRWVPPALIALAFAPIVAGAFRLLEVAGGPATLPAHPGVFTQGRGEPIAGAGKVSAAFLLAAWWAINLDVAQRIIGRQPTQRRGQATFRFGVK